jgi:hypothetical protein
VSAGNEQGRAHALTLVNTLRPGGHAWLRFLFGLTSFLPLAKLTLLRLRRIHFGRWTLISRLPPTGRRPPRPLMLFESNFSGGFASYIDAFAYVFPHGMWLIWGSSAGYPGSVPAGPFKEWIQDHEYVASHYYAAYPEATTRDILAALEVDQPLREFQLRFADAGPAEFRAEFDRLLASLQRWL